MTAQYSRLPTSEYDVKDAVAFDFSSYNTYGSSRYNSEKYKSIFVYGDRESQMSDASVTLSVGRSTDSTHRIHITLIYNNSHIIK